MNDSVLQCHWHRMITSDFEKYAYKGIILHFLFLSLIMVVLLLDFNNGCFMIRFQQVELSPLMLKKNIKRVSFSLIFF